MSRKGKGSNAERELIKLFWDNGWAAMRAAGSGSNHYPCPDVIAGNAIRRLAIECKATKDNKKYVEKREIIELQTFASRIGAEGWLGVKFSNRGWFFINLEDLEDTGESLAISLEDAKRRGLSFDELIEQKKTMPETRA